MDKLAIIGGRPLYGKLPISGAKNSALKVMVASLLTSQPLRLKNVPDLADIRQLTALLEQHGVGIQREGANLNLHAGEITSTVAPYELVRKMRASFNVLGPILAREGKAKVSLPGGCAIGARPVDLHLKAFEAMGAEIELDEGYVLARARGGLKGAKILFPFVSVGATEHAMLAATLAKGTTILNNAAREPEIADLANCLIAMGAQIAGAGTSTITIEGVDRLSGAEHTVLPDRIETGSYAMAVGVTGGELTLTDTNIDLLGAAAESLIEAGLELTALDNGIRVTMNRNRLKAVDVITQPFPGFPTDLQAQFMALMATAEGTSTIKETIFENRFMHVPELGRMGADIHINGQVATVKGKAKLKGAPVMATDLRASMSLVLAGLGAEGQSMVSRLYHLDRGFERLEEKLQNVGALVERVPDND
ncbi:UDP-N-acetylglucosamine 1-carboxyvinyltransferase [Aquisalinus flavus]|uniref:UDP-N-acetylglucosamine 1-carboxyvinyltransferase n=1 Tax=Aquisalinus flavus TaxID=1526572 RepID=A0A8J2V4U3_9PROT|nr:UDP-N-acetylglucosamine 1-carboxyvinyltransferase [Aquisalinus flavus]MBD0427386.1 UDP-N-acetylglucosamine 1-carboxyvinyltransferase [Aquisalinus flavus]UNE47190.1 UDP-N-acetylglucosamine 1-carboxyvinyltransferase [Aquisalinus flavus]GGD00573.1 UDP-N-acetylglucosamine 1-carboxyvinyltransferase [Aquisalinus flavus]